MSYKVVTQCLWALLICGAVLLVNDSGAQGGPPAPSAPAPSAAKTRANAPPREAAAVPEGEPASSQATPSFTADGPLPKLRFSSLPTADYPLPTLQVGDRDPLRPPAIETTHVPPIPQELHERLRQYQNVRAAGFRGWSPDGKGLLISTRFAETVQLHRVHTPGGRREQITFFDEPVRGFFLPKGTDGALVLSMSQGGNENDQLYHFSVRTGRARLLTDGKSRNAAGAIRPDGQSLVFGSNRRNGKDTDLYLIDPRQPGSDRLLLKVDGEFWSARDWSRDGGQLLLQRVVSAAESYPALFDLASERRTDIALPGAGKAACGPLEFATDGRAAFIACDALSDFRQLARVDLKDQSWTWLTADLKWDVDELAVDPTTGRVAWAINDNGGSTLYLLDGEKRRQVPLPLGIVDGCDFSPDGKHLGFTLARPDAPPDVYSLDLDDSQLTRWTYSEVGGLDPESFIAPAQVMCPSFDGRDVPAYVFRPARAKKDAPCPVLIVIHGGPESQYRPTFSGVDQFMVQELGLAVVHPNVRGSSGYGKTYLGLDDREKREDSVKDIGAILDWIERQPELDRSRVGVMGASYGGYMVLASLVTHGERLKAGIDIVGIASFESFLKNTSEYRRDLRRVEYGDERDPAMLEVFRRIDPLRHADRIRSALMVVHGKNDPRVPFSEAEQIAREVAAAGRDVWTVYAENEGHGFAKKVNRDYLTAATVLFLQQHLIGGAVPPAASE